MTRYQYLLTNEELDWRRVNDELEVGYKVVLRPYVIKVTRKKGNGVYALYVDDIKAGSGDIDSKPGQLMTVVNERFQHKEDDLKQWAKDYFISEM